MLPGSSHVAAAGLPDGALIAWGETAARLGQALRGFTHPCARRVMAWDVQHALTARTMLDDIRDAHVRETVVRVLDEFERRAAPIWARLRAQVVHTDLTVDNVLTDEGGLITGIIDFCDSGAERDHDRDQLVARRPRSRGVGVRLARVGSARR